MSSMYVSDSEVLWGQYFISFAFLSSVKVTVTPIRLICFNVRTFSRPHLLPPSQKPCIEEETEAQVKVTQNSSISIIHPFNKYTKVPAQHWVTQAWSL